MGVGLSLFVGFFLSVIFGINRAARTCKAMPKEDVRLGRVLMATIIGIMLVIYTVSSIIFIPIIYWFIAGLGMAYIRLSSQLYLECS